MILNGPGSSTKDYKIHFCKLNKVLVITSCYKYLCFETFYFYFYSDPRNLIFEKNCGKPRNIKKSGLMLTAFLLREEGGRGKAY